jgi:TonB family protein
VRVLRTDRRGLIFTWGVVRPTVIVPSGAERWSPDRVRVVLAHELAHAKRGDWLIQIVCDTIRALCWFNPIIWIACRRLRHESERAADDAVINGGVDGVAYAAELVDLARAFAVLGRPWLPAPAILRASNFERRISSMLSAHLNRRPVSRLTRTITVAAVSAVAVAIASAQGVFSSFSGTVYDPLRGLLPGVRLVLTSAQTDAKYEIRSDRDGRFEFVGLPPGRYALETELPGFRALKGSVEIAGQDIQRELTLAVGSLQETVAVGPSDVEMRREGGRPRVTTSWTTTCTPDRQPGGIGGNLRAPTKLVHVLPRFPANLAAAGASGVVVLDATIGADGTIQEVRTRSSPHPDFEAAAIDAVREWEFSQTLLNCVPVEVAMTVTINFAAR